MRLSGLLLDVLIQDGPWQVKSKVLSVISALAESPACAAHVDFFRENQEDVAALVGVGP